MLFGLGRGAEGGRGQTLDDGAVITVGAARVRLLVNARARRVSLRLDARAGAFIAVAPTRRGLPAAAAFARSRQAWMEAILAKTPATQPLRPGLIIPLEGQACRLERAAMRIPPTFHRSSAGEPDRLVLYGRDDGFGRAAVRALKSRALERAQDLSARHVARLGGLPAPEVAVMDARLRWGSCRGAHAGRPASLRYNWRLILAPPDIFDYVAAHECAHLIEANHSKAFWGIVASLCPDLEARRRWLRAHGQELHTLTP